MSNTKTWLIFLATLAVLGAWAVQHRTNVRLAAEVAALRQQSAPTTGPDAEDPRAQATTHLSEAAADHSSDTRGLGRRLTELEKTVAQLARSSDYLMERGQLPLTSDKQQGLFNLFADPAASNSDRLQALRQLRRNKAMTDDVIPHALDWLRNATDTNLREDIVEQLDGLTNATLRGPLLAVAASDPDADVRQQAVQNLRRFAGDPEAEAQLWQTWANDPDEDVREEAEEALIEGPASPTRLTAMRARATDPNSSAEERLVAWRALREAGQEAPETSELLARQAQSIEDPVALAQFFESWDDTIDRPTASDAAFLPTLLQGLQNPHPLVRERAADALRDFSADPNVQEWLRYVVENDPDPTVRREALRGVNGLR